MNSYKGFIHKKILIYKTFCSERNNTDLVGVTCPGAGGRKSRRPRQGSERPHMLTLADVRCALDNGCLRHCVSCASIKYLKKPPDGRARQMTIARSKGPKA
ncbi:hypothetical protein T09_9267 [Trichinella sp. T9]|nr:hypothetical protein T09_9267 [Trichinella sp. T9]